MTSLLRAAWGRMPFGSSQRGVNSSAPSIESSDMHNDTTINEKLAPTKNVETNDDKRVGVEKEQVKKKDKKKKKRKSKSASAEELQAVIDPRASQEQNNEVVIPNNEPLKDPTHSPGYGDKKIEMNGEEESHKKKKGKRNSMVKKGKSVDGNLEAPVAAVLDTEVVGALPIKSTKDIRDGSGKITKKQTNGFQEDGFGHEPEPKEASKPEPNTKKTRKSRKSAKEVVTLDPEVEEETVDLPTSKFSKVKRKAKTALRKPVTSLTVNSDGNRGQQGPEDAEENSQEYHVQASNQLMSDARSAAEIEGDETSKPPSKKALGKRKASFEMVIGSARKPKRSRKTKSPPGADLRTMGFNSSSSRGVGSISAESLSKTAEELWMQSINESDDLEHKVSRAYRPTPTFTAVNHPSQRSQGSQPIRNEIETDLNDASEQGEPVQKPLPLPSKSSTKKVKRRLPVEETIYSQPEATPIPKSKKNVSKRNELTPGQESKGSGQIAYKGKIPEESIDAMRNAIEIYREAHDLSQFQVIELLHEDASLAGKPSDELWKGIFEAVPGMRQRKVRDTCRRKFHNYPARGVWSAEADEELKNAYERLPGKWKDIGQLIHRMPEDCRDRWRNHLACGDSMIKYEWNEDDENSLRAAVAECIEHVKELKRIDKDNRYAGKDNESLVDWQIVSEKLGHTRSRLQCINKWKQLKEREESDIEDTLPVICGDNWRSRNADVLTHTFTASQRLELLYAIRDSGAGKESKIPWRVVEKNLTWYDKGVRLAIRLCFRRLREKIPNHIYMKLKDILVIIIDAFEGATPNEPADFTDDTPAPKKRKSADKNSKRKSRARAAPERLADTTVAKEKQPDSAKRRNRQRSAISDEYVHESDDNDDDDDDDTGNLGPDAATDQTPKDHQENLDIGHANAETLTLKKQKKHNKKREGPVEELTLEDTVPEVVNKQLTDCDQMDGQNVIEPESTEAPGLNKNKRSKKPKATVEESAEDLISKEPIAAIEETLGANDANSKRKKRSKKTKSSEEQLIEMDLEEADAQESLTTAPETEINDNTFWKPVKRKKKRKAAAIEELIAQEPEAEAAPKSRRSRKLKAKKAEFPIDDNSSITDEPAILQKKKLHKRMKLQGESQNQEPIAEEYLGAPELSDDLEVVMASLHKGRRKSRDEKARNLKINGHVSKEQMNDSDDEMEDRIQSFHETIPAVDTNGNLNDDDFQDNGEPLSGEDLVNINFINDNYEDGYMNRKEDYDEDDQSTVPTNLEIDSVASKIDNATSDYYISQDGSESVDLDAPVPHYRGIKESGEKYDNKHSEVSDERPSDGDDDDNEEHTITMNGLKRTVASPNLDTEMQYSNSNDDEDNRNGYGRRGRSRGSSPISSSSDESIPAVAMRRMVSVEL